MTLVERGRLVAVRAGAERVFVVERAEQVAKLADWLDRDAGLLFIDARGQAVHMDLVKDLHGDTSKIAVDEDGYAGALWAPSEAAAEIVQALCDSAAEGDRRLAERWLASDVEQVELPPGAIAHHTATNRAERKAAAHMLYGMIHKGQDGPITRYVYRPVSLQITRVLLHTPITPNQVTFFCAMLSGIGVYFTAHYEYISVMWGALFIQLAGFLDGSDGEIARLKLRSSKLGAWLDTLVDEATSVAYVGALGYHVYLHYGEDWVYALIFVGLATHVITIYIIYYYLIVATSSGNSQDYAGKLRIVGGAGAGPLRLEPIPAQTTERSPFMEWCAEYVPHVLRRDFLCLLALGLAVIHQTELLYAILMAGSTISTLWLTPEHVRLRLQLRKLNKQRANAG